MLDRLKQAIAVRLIRLIQKYGPRTVQVNGRSYRVSERVFNPKYYVTSALMAEHIHVLPGDAVLDMGTGSGIQAITAAVAAARVIAIDINFEAVLSARDSVQSNGLGHAVSVITGDLFAPLRNGIKFDVILFTPPYMDGEIRSPLDHALFDPGKDLIRRFYRDARGHLADDGYVLMLYSTIASPEKALSLAEELGWEYHVVARKEMMMETLCIYELTMN